MQGKFTKTDFERELNDQGFPSNEIRNKRSKNYGSWLRRCHLNEFNILYEKKLKEGDYK